MVVYFIIWKFVLTSLHDARQNINHIIPLLSVAFSNVYPIGRTLFLFYYFLTLFALS